MSGIVGVPWQDLATPETLGDPTRLEYMTAQDRRLLDEQLDGLTGLQEDTPEATP